MHRQLKLHSERERRRERVRKVGGVIYMEVGPYKGFEATVKYLCKKCQRFNSIKKAMSPPIGVLM